MLITHPTLSSWLTQGSLLDLSSNQQQEDLWCLFFFFYSPSSPFSFVSWSKENNLSSRSYLTLVSYLQTISEYSYFGGENLNI